IGREDDRSGQQRHREGDVEVVEDPLWGRFPVRTETVDPQSYVSFRWASAFPGEDLRDGNSTLIEFFLQPQGDGTVLRVIESGFASLDAVEETRTKSFDSNVDGWAEQMAVIKGRAERVAA
ncbi:SRPBCC domain-containing protein, partial [Phytoactinopolyspora endophytica]|uniref:SRPBCC domain-containing protein n=1 Tax=Phytoactinopolyspora endophytica TaxID=1642495 RepID=UPI00197B0ABB